MVLLAAVLAINTADTGTVGAVASQIEHDLHVGHAELGLLATVSTGLGAILCLPAGVLADRTARVRILIVTVALWSVAMLASGLAQSYLWLLLSRLMLGAAVAAAGPVVASLVGDLVPTAHRGRIYGWILSGELFGAGLGLVVGGWIAATLSWRYAFFLLSVLSAVLAGALLRWLPEPPRGPPPRGHPAPANNDRDHDPAGATAKHGDANQDSDHDGSDDGKSLWWVTRYVLAIRTNRLLIVASSVGYFFFAGLRTFAIVFVQDHYHLSLATVSSLIPVIGVGALLGVQAGGRISDRAARQGHRAARVHAPAIGYAVAALLFAPGLASGDIAVALPLFAAGAAGLAAANPPLDAARLDIVPGWLWGRAESIRTVLRLAAEATAPLLFGLLADRIGGQSGRGLRDTFLIMLVPLAASALLTWRAASSYPADREAVSREPDDPRGRHPEPVPP